MTEACNRLSEPVGDAIGKLGLAAGSHVICRHSWSLDTMQQFEVLLHV